MSLRQTILDQVIETAGQRGVPASALTDDLPLLHAGLDSLCIAIIVARLDDALDLDPLSSDEGVAFPTTLGAFIRIYEVAAARA